MNIYEHAKHILKPNGTILYGINSRTILEAGLAASSGKEVVILSLKSSDVPCINKFDLAFLSYEIKSIKNNPLCINFQSGGRISERFHVEEGTKGMNPDLIIVNENNK